MAKVLLSLLLIGATCGLLLVGTHLLTAEPIQLNREARARALATQMLGTPIPADVDIKQSMYGSCDHWVFQQATSSGYAGPIAWLILWRAPSDGLTLRVTDHRETPGIGDFIDHTRDPWMLQHDGKSADAYTVIDNVSGATITTKAVRQAADRAIGNLKIYCE